MRVLFRFNRTDHWYENPAKIQQSSSNDGPRQPAQILRMNARYGGPTAEMIQQAGAGEQEQRQLASRHPYHYRQSFDDWRFYCRLQSRDRVVATSIKRVLVFHSRGYVMGLQTTYESTLSDGSKLESTAARHLYHRGWYSYSGGPMERSSLDLEEGEYITNIRTRQGDILDQLIFVTNRRVVKFGGDGGAAEQEMSPDLAFSVVAFAGVGEGVLKRMGYYAQSHSWVILKPYILQRKLVETKRARPRAVSSFQDSNRRLPRRIEADETMCILSAVISETRDDIFKQILSYLVRIPSDNKHS